MAEYEIISKYKDMEPEVIDTADTLRNAAYLLAEYSLAFGPEFILYIKEVM